MIYSERSIVTGETGGNGDGGRLVLYKERSTAYCRALIRGRIFFATSQLGNKRRPYQSHDRPRPWPPKADQQIPKPP